MDCENCDNCELRLRKKHNFANNTIQFFECRSQSQHNTIWFSRRSQLRKLRKLLYWRFFLWKIDQSKLDSRFPEFFKFKFDIWVKMNQKNTPWTKTKVGRVFPMLILSEFQLIHSKKKSQNKNSQFSQKTQIAIRNFRNLWNCGFRNFANNTVEFWAHFTTLTAPTSFKLEHSAPNLPKLIAFSVAFGPFAPWTRFTDFWFAAWFSFNFRWGWVAINVGQTWIRFDSFSITRVAWTVTWTPFFPFTRTTALWPVACLAFFEFIRAVAVFWSWFGKPWWTDAFSEWYCYHMFYQKTHFWKQKLDWKHFICIVYNISLYVSNIQVLFPTALICFQPQIMFPAYI